MWIPKWDSTCFIVLVSFVDFFGSEWGWHCECVDYVPRDIWDIWDIFWIIFSPLHFNLLVIIICSFFLHEPYDDIRVQLLVLARYLLKHFSDENDMTCSLLTSLLYCVSCLLFAVLNLLTNSSTLLLSHANNLSHHEQHSIVPQL